MWKTCPKWSCPLSKYHRHEDLCSWPNSSVRIPETQPRKADFIGGDEVAYLWPSQSAPLFIHVANLQERWMLCVVTVWSEEFPAQLLKYTKQHLLFASAGKVTSVAQRRKKIWTLKLWVLGFSAGAKTQKEATHPSKINSSSGIAECIVDECLLIHACCVFLEWFPFLSMLMQDISLWMSLLVRKASMCKVSD